VGCQTQCAAIAQHEAASDVEYQGEGQRHEHHREDICVCRGAALQQERNDQDYMAGEQQPRGKAPTADAPLDQGLVGARLMVAEVE